MNVKSNKVINPSELISFIIGVFVVFIILFPKNTLEKYVLSENKNYTLAVLYLKGLSKANPYNFDFVLYLIKFEIKLGHLNKAADLIEKYSDFFADNATFLKEAYILNKSFYFKTEKMKYLLYAKKYLKIILLKDKKYDFAYMEARKLNLPDIEYLALKHLVKKRPALLKKFIQTAELLKKYDELPALYEKEYKQTGDVKWLIREANLLLYVKKDYKAYKIYLKIFQKNRNLSYFKKAVNILVFYKKKNIAVKILKKYENYFFKKKDIKALTYILRIYMDCSKFNDAKKLSKKIMRFYL